MSIGGGIIGGFGIGEGVPQAATPATSATLAMATSGTVGSPILATATVDGLFTGTATFTPTGSAAAGLSPIDRSYSDEAGAKSASFTPTEPGDLVVTLTTSPALAIASPAKSATITQAPATTSRRIAVYANQDWTDPDDLAIEVIDDEGETFATFGPGDATEFPDGSGNFLVTIPGLSYDVDYAVGLTLSKGGEDHYDTLVFRVDSPPPTPTQIVVAFLSRSLTDVKTATVGGALAGAWALAWGKAAVDKILKRLNVWGPGNSTNTPSAAFSLDDTNNPGSRTPL